MPVQKAELTADISEHAFVAESSKIWHYAQIRERASIGENCVVGRGAYIGSGVTVGDNCKIQNYALIYEPALLEEGVFIGPAVVLTNDEFPRAVSPSGVLKSSTDWEQVGVHIKNGASIGANATCIAPLIIGSWALVGAGSVVTKDVPNFALVVGSPARRIGWVGKAGKRLLHIENTEKFQCPVTGELYHEVSYDELIEVIQVD